ncbi:MAG: glycerophosphodiester phosphodiesterase [Clostridia bacterium]|nr:glycerophosphodiester phosphodiesterase [Clostridia bacterium]
MIFRVILSVLVALVLIVGVSYPLLLLRPRRRNKVGDALLCDYAHRGLHGNGIPENSRAAFELACRKGCGIELDVQLSRDGVVMVFHDYTLVRMTGCEKKLCELDAAELTALTLADSEETIPTLEEVLRLVDGRVPLLIELKGEDYSTALCEKVAAALSGYAGAYCFESFNPLLVRQMKKQMPDAVCGLLYTNVCREKKKYSALNMALTAMAFNFLACPDFIAYNQNYRAALPVRWVTKLYRAPRFVWTVRSDDDLATAHQKGECAIFEHCGA